MGEGPSTLAEMWLAYEDPSMAVERIVLGLDGSSGAQAAAQWCAEHAGQLEAEVLAVHAIAPTLAGSLPAPVLEPGVTASERPELLAALRQWCAPLRDAGVAFDARILDGAPAPAIMELADEVSATLVVVGRRGHGGFAGLLLGSVPHRLTHHCPHPVLVVPAG